MGVEIEYRYAEEGRNGTKLCWSSTLTLIVYALTLRKYNGCHRLVSTDPVPGIRMLMSVHSFLGTVAQETYDSLRGCIDINI